MPLPERANGGPLVSHMLEGATPTSNVDTSEGRPIDELEDDWVDDNTDKPPQASKSKGKRKQVRTTLYTSDTYE